MNLFPGLQKLSTKKSAKGFGENMTVKRGYGELEFKKSQ